MITNDKISRISDLLNAINPEDYGFILDVVKALSQGADNKATLDAGSTVQQAAEKEVPLIDEEGGNSVAV